MKARTRSAYLPTYTQPAWQAQRGLVPAAPGMGVACRTRHKYVRATPLGLLAPLGTPSSGSSPPAAPPPYPDLAQPPYMYARETETSVTSESPRHRRLAACNVSDRSQLKPGARMKILGCTLESSIRRSLYLHVFMRDDDAACPIYPPTGIVRIARSVMNRERCCGPPRRFLHSRIHGESLDDNRGRPQE